MPFRSSWRVTSVELQNRGRTDLVGPLRRAIRRAGEPTVAAVRAAWLGVEVTSSRGGTTSTGRSPGLRARVAAATYVQITPSGIRIAVRPAVVDPVYGQTLPWYLDGVGKPWRHPVFGRRDNPQDWQQQRGEEVFFSTIRAHQPAFQAAIDRAMEDVARNF